VKFCTIACELAVVLGRSARQVGSGSQALGHVAGGIASPTGLRRSGILLNWVYRPNLRVKNRDGGTSGSPGFVGRGRIVGRVSPGEPLSDVRNHMSSTVSLQQDRHAITRDLIFSSTLSLSHRVLRNALLRCPRAM